MAIVINPVSPVAVSVFGLDIRWYALAYIIGIALAYILFRRLVRDKNSGVALSKKQYDDFLTYIVFGVIIGGRLGYVLFYNLPYFLSNPLEIFMVWHGGMSFHGGLIGVIIANFLFSRSVHVNGWRMLDLVATVTPIGLFCGRIANFINMEVMGRATDMPWGVVFRGVSQIPRHPSPLYEAASEGILLFIIMILLYTKTNLKKYPGALTGIMGMLYAVFRVVCEFFRAPDTQIGFLTSWGLTMGQLLSGILFACGAVIFACAIKKHK